MWHGSDIRDIRNTLNLFETCCSDLSDNKMKAKCDIYEIDTPLTKLSYDKQFAYFVSAEDVEDQIKDVIKENDYDHIFIVVKLRRWNTWKRHTSKWLDRFRLNGLLWNRFFKY